jgi:GLPGLI family protein
MKKFLIIISLSFFFKTFSQSYEGKVVYKFFTEQALIDSKTINNKDKNYNGMLRFINKSLKSSRFEFELKFHGSKSIFFKQKSLQNDNNKSYKIANALLKADNVYYSNYKTNRRKISKSVYGENYIVVSELDNLKWKLTNNSKIVGKYKCFKASSYVMIKNNKGIFKKEITAWYAPDIPVNFGPKGYGGLPGLILELIEDNYRYLATKIVISKKNKIKVNFSEKGKLITQDELDEIGQAIYKKKKFAQKN